ncbi:hypothetical protein CRUP_009363 [Coryphaenoides rupestris]|nr:hypothetical protein CRUP_009363 [Coryphaenoides rupestris]
MASSLSATVVSPAELDSCVDPGEQWRGALLIREKSSFIAESSRTSGKSKKSKLLLDQLSSLRGRPAASQLGSQRWREILAKRPSSMPVPEVEIKGEGAHYFLLVQGSEAGGGGACRARMLHSANQINGAAAVATVDGLLREKSLASETSLAAATTVPVKDIKALLNRAREQYLKMTTAPCLPETKRRASQQSDWPERSVLHNVENLRKRRQKNRDSLLGPKDCQRVSLATLDARELLKHFTADGLPAGDLQPLVICRGFCLDTQRALERDLGITRLQSRLVRFETQTTCSKEPCPLPFALSPAPAPPPPPPWPPSRAACPTGRPLQLQNADVARLKHGG